MFIFNYFFIYFILFKKIENFYYSTYNDKNKKEKRKMYVEQFPPSINRLQQLVTSTKEETTNDKNSRGRKICPITYVELNMDNSIKIGKTIYSTAGLRALFKDRLPDQKSCRFFDNYSVIRGTRDPMTNIPFTHENARDICSLLFNKFESYW
jgi:hypothetical protein